MVFQSRSLLNGIIFLVFVLINVASAGFLPDLPVGMDCVEYLVDTKTKEHLTKLYRVQYEDVRHFRDEIQEKKQKIWLNFLVSIISDNGKLFNSLVEPICGINEKVLQYTETIVHEQLIDSFDINVHNDLKKIFEFAHQYQIVVDESFLHANQNISNILRRYDEIGYLDEDQLSALEYDLETLTFAVDENVSYAEGAVNGLKRTINNFVELTKQLASILQRLQLKFQNPEQRQKIIMNELKMQVELCLEEISKQNFQNDFEHNIDRIKEELQYAENATYCLFGNIEDVILGREPENFGKSLEDEFSPETSTPFICQNVPSMTLNLPLANLKPLTINTENSRVQELIEYFSGTKNIVTPRQLVNSAKKDALLMDLLKKDQINITLDEKQLVKSRIRQFQECKIPKPPKAKESPNKSNGKSQLLNK